MKQLTQQLKSGKMEILEVPFPALNKGYLLVHNHFSVISAGTEGKTVTDARKSYIAKARTRQKEVKQVIDMVKTNGLLPTYKLVMNKLEAPAALGYSTAGEVIAIGEGVTGFKVGDMVACGGATASHADVVSVPRNLCAKIDSSVDLKHAAFATIAAIAIQGIRQADLRTGENCVIIGLGIIGQLTAQVLEASGITPVGIDISPTQLEIAKKAGLRYGFDRKKEGLEEQIKQITHGNGTDAVIITAGTASLDPVEFAGKIARKKGKIVVVGAVPTGFSRENYYKKELDLRMSSSYGPGRYDPDYEEKGIDYPIGYVRFTEQRNMETYLRLLADGKLNVDKLISHTFDLDKASSAYSMILDKSESFSGILIKYDTDSELKRTVHFSHKKLEPEEPNVGFIGAGSFAQNMLLPNMKNQCQFVGVATARGNNSRYVAEKYGFSYCAETADDLLNDTNINTVFITTRHNLHAEYVKKAIDCGKNVFVEKPLAMNEEELELIRHACEAKQNTKVMIGFNRRFAPAVQDLKKLFLDEQPKTILIRINAGVMPPEHWVNDPTIGGGRIIGEACHFIDLAMFLAGAKIVSVYANAMDDPFSFDNSVVINLEFENGSIASVNYFSNGNKNLPKENIEVFCGETVAVIDDFKVLKTYSKSKKNFTYKGQVKGHANEVKLFLRSIKEGLPCPIPFEDSYLSSLVTFKVLESIKTRREIRL